MKFTVLGFGGRGSLYAKLFSQTSATELTAVCEILPERLATAGKQYGLNGDQLFLSDQDFIAQGKLADLCVIATQDEQHLQHALMALNVGYDLLLEKPIATTFSDCLTLFRKAKELGRKVYVCHVLRYAPFFSMIKQELDSGAYGRIAALNLTENIAWWHFAGSFVRGSWSVSPPSAPLVVAKTCHDLDILSWLFGSQCRRVSSFGSLGYFTPENAPEGSADRCPECSVKENCIYNAEKHYMPNELVEDPFGRCVFKRGSNACDRQIVNMEFDGGAVAHLTVTAFSQDCYREIHVHCEKGEIYGNMRDNILTCNIYGGDSKQLDVAQYAQGVHGHGGGDALLVEDIVATYNSGVSSSLTSIENSMQSHAIGFAAEDSRVRDGSVVVPPKFEM